MQVVLPLATKTGEWIEFEEKESVIALTIGVEAGGQIVRYIPSTEAWGNTFVGQFSCVAKKVTPFVWVLADEETAKSLPKIFNCA